MRVADKNFGKVAVVLGGVIYLWQYKKLYINLYTFKIKLSRLMKYKRGERDGYINDREWV